MKSFVDVLFILLLGTIVMLTESVQLGTIDAALARRGGDGISSVRADEVKVVVVADDDLEHDGRRYPNGAALLSTLGPEGTVLLLPSGEALPHRRMIEIWLQLRDAGLDVRLGVELTEDEATTASGREV